MRCLGYSKCSAGVILLRCVMLCACCGGYGIRIELKTAHSAVDYFDFGYESQTLILHLSKLLFYSVALEAVHYLEMIISLFAPTLDSYRLQMGSILLEP